MKLLVIVDFQKDFITGNLGFSGAEKLDAGIAAKIREYNECGYLIVETRDTHKSNYLETREGKHLPVPHCIKGTDGWEAYGETANEINKIRGDFRFYRIEKESFAAHPTQVLDVIDWHETNGINMDTVDEIEFVGLVSNICVISNICVFQGAFPNAQIVVDPNLIASFDNKAHEAVLEVMKSLQVVFI